MGIVCHTPWICDIIHFYRCSKLIFEHFLKCCSVKGKAKPLMSKHTVSNFEVELSNLTQASFTLKKKRREEGAVEEDEG